MELKAIECKLFPYGRPVCHPVHWTSYICGRRWLVCCNYFTTGLWLASSCDRGNLLGKGECRWLPPSVHPPLSHVRDVRCSLRLRFEDLRLSDLQNIRIGISVQCQMSSFTIKLNFTHKCLTWPGSNNIIMLDDRSNLFPIVYLSYRGGE